MDYLYESALKMHKFFSICVIISVLFYLFLVSLKTEDKLKFTKRIRIFLPLYYSVWAALFVTGAVILPIFQFKLNFDVIFMLTSFVVCIVLSIISYKKLKIAWKTKNFTKYKKSLFKILIFILTLNILSYFLPNFLRIY